MKVDGYYIGMESFYRSVNYQSTSLSLKISLNQENQSSFRGVYINLSQKEVSLSGETMSAEELKTFIIDFLVEKLTGKKLKKLKMEDISGGQNLPVEIPENRLPALSASVHTQKLTYQMEEVNFKAFGYIRTPEGGEISFQIEFSLKRELLQYEESKTDFAVVDPLVINLDGKLEDMLTDSSFEFDIDGDGEDEKLPGLSDGRGFLVFDRNKNKKADDRSELLGAKTGDGFRELKELDRNRNGWIDKADDIFEHFYVWNPGKWFKKLDEVGIDTLFTEGIHTPFRLNQAFLNKSGVFLDRNGSPGIISQLDFLV
ncbi:hypothetical protein [Persephonella sp.]